MLSDILDVPVDLVGKVPCQDPATRGLFQTLDLDIDLDDPEYLALSPEGKQARYAAKAAAEEAAVGACSLCPIVNECREWAMNVRVHGVAGALTEKQRYRRSDDAEFSRRSRNAVPDDVVQAWTNDGYSTQDIADILECSTRTVARARRRAQDNADTHSTSDESKVDSHVKAREPRSLATLPVDAKTALDFDNLTPESLAMYDYLARQTTPVNRKDVAQHIARFVTSDTAMKWGANLPCAEAKRETQGALKFARNRIDIAYRHGRVVRSNQGKDTLLSLPANIKRDYLAWQAARCAVSA